MTSSTVLIDSMEQNMFIPFGWFILDVVFVGLSLLTLAFIIEILRSKK